MSSGSISFDYVIGNPPFGKTKIPPFIKTSFDLAQSKGVIKLITPSTWLSLIASGSRDKKVSELRRIIKENKTSIELFNGNAVFADAKLPSSLCVVTIEKGVTPTKVKRAPQILVKGLLYGDEYQSIGYNKFNECGAELRELFLDTPLARTLKGSLQALPEDWMDNLDTNPASGRWIVNLPRYRGNVSNTEQLQYGLNWFTLFSEIQLEKGEVITRGSPKKSGVKNEQFWFAFNSEDEANNFIDFLRHPLIRALASVIKSNIKNDVFSNIPMPKDGFKRKYTEDELYKEFGLGHLKPTIESFFEKLNQIEQKGQASNANAPSSVGGKSKTRIQTNSEFFTPERLVNQIVNQIIETVSLGLGIEDLVFEPSLGDGAFVLAVLKHKLQLDTPYTKEKQAKLVLSTVYGGELMRDNLDKAKSAIRNMLISEYGIEESFYNNELSEIVDHNLVQVDTINPISKSKLQWPEWLIESIPDSYWITYAFPKKLTTNAHHDYRSLLDKRIVKASNNIKTDLARLC